MSLPAGAMLFGLSLTEAEFQLILEVVKGTLLAFGAGLIALIFNVAAKRRELHAALYNELIKPRILALHKINADILAVMSDYETAVEAILDSDMPGLAASDDDDAVKDRIESTVNHVTNFVTKDLPARMGEVREYSRKIRYQTGETYYALVRSRTKVIEETLEKIWTHYYIHGYSDIMTEYIENRITLEEVSSHARYKAKIYALLSRRSIGMLLNALHDDYVSVINQRRPSADLQAYEAVLRRNNVFARAHDFTEALMADRAADLGREIGLPAMR